MKRYQVNRNLFNKPGLVAMLLTAGLFSVNTQAETGDNQQLNTTSMETITITYRNAFDYALYQRTTEMLAGFNRELEQKIVFEARSQSKDMANSWGVQMALNSQQTPQNQYEANSLPFEGVLSQPK
ncbi:hypothetical protein [Shewanella gaetbuli]|uniref:Uncharacterized protein n=1 Tax=Shewanella gaetbuli TaxID=220752 RepID=A0A9X1ZQ47_9GAMM|nr:hypothetical protein [Shewanella gaetbuli]MCL1142003.1 hypothetical protein [Shewanella gaetbuli]